jgi:hypothetical protein
MRGLKAISRTRSARHRRAWIAVSTTLASVLSLTTVVALFGLRPVLQPVPPPASAAACASAAQQALVAVIRIRQGHVELDGAIIARTADIEASDRVQNVKPLYEALKLKREPGMPTGDVTIEVDDGVSASVVKSVFQTTVMAGFSNIMFRVQGRGMLKP